MVGILKDKLTKILLNKKLVKQEDLEKALSTQKAKGGSLSEIMVQMGLVSKNDLMILLSHELGIPPINLSRYKIDPLVVKLVPKKIVKHYHIMPISKVADTLTIAMSDPLNILAIDDIKALTGFKINPVVTTEKDIDEAIGEHYGEDAYTTIERIVYDSASSADLKMVEEKAGEEIAASADLLKMTQEAPVVKITNLLLAEAVSSRASDILVEPLEDEIRVRYRVDGVLREARRVPKSFQSAIVSRLKVMADLNIAERRLPQDGRFKVKLYGREIDFRISVIPSSKGEKAALRVLDKSQAMLDIERLGFNEASLEQLRNAAKKPHGMILICGPTGCGKTTTLYSLLEYVNSPDKNIVTVEDPIEYIIEGINQVTARSDIGLTFASALRAILRQDPNVIMIGEIRDLETVDIAIKAALTGHLVLSTLHTTTAAGSITRLINMGIEPFLITSSLVLVGAERLVRRICPACREPYELSNKMTGRLHLEAEKGKLLFYRGKGCESCLGTGYRGRAGLIEVLTLTPKIKELVLGGVQEYQIKDAARASGMKTLRESGLEKAREGVTTLDEILRVTAGDQDMEAV